MNWLDILSFW